MSLIWLTVFASINTAITSDVDVCLAAPGPSCQKNAGPQNALLQSKKELQRNSAIAGESAGRLNEATEDVQKSDQKAEHRWMPQKKGKQGSITNPRVLKGKACKGMTHNLGKLASAWRCRAKALRTAACKTNDKVGVMYSPTQHKTFGCGCCKGYVDAQSSTKGSDTWDIQEMDKPTLKGILKGIR
eukprot:gnl/MRDRNA2_/MRDRNA2_29260_c0_seq1.p1 gnl/MRDRNA2_/MRDRNA2_29260_c0~~gnl/MRDRNA2_/MRDRNA2_29260_c0_seq1.p1  ORF type:complete len:186 (+),score=29.82 gnl/MRDRNA2_/MRDRNA2_29260_c0_seq1:105-662(+)